MPITNMDGYLSLRKRDAVGAGHGGCRREASSASNDAAPEGAGFPAAASGGAPAAVRGQGPSHRSPGLTGKLSKVSSKPPAKPAWYKNTYFWIAGILFILGIIGLPFF